MRVCVCGCVCVWLVCVHYCLYLHAHRHILTCTCTHVSLSPHPFTHADLESQLAEYRDTALSPPAATPTRTALSSSVRHGSTPEVVSPALTGPAAARARDRHMISTLEARLSDMQDEIKTLRRYTARLQDELLRISPKALAQASMPPPGDDG